MTWEKFGEFVTANWQAIGILLALLRVGMRIELMFSEYKNTRNQLLRLVHACCSKHKDDGEHIRSILEEKEKKE